MFKSVRASVDSRIPEWEWMDNSSKKVAIDKVIIEKYFFNQVKYAHITL